MTLKAPAVELDLDNPPIDPPGGADLVMWSMARELFADHEADHDAPCPSCQMAWPCPGNLLARQGLTVACGGDNTMADYWRGLARIRAREADR
ncbi:hypothetical protein [Catellatospora sp. NPDC049609]|uniref:hypothetical protein n=1 Tax=Catellatospora sp. NPDC049609 TaxID=3155505 RepID=UPI0034395D2E